MASIEEYPGFKIKDITPKERFSAYVKFGWLIFSVTVQEIIEIAFDKKGPVHYIFVCFLKKKISKFFFFKNFFSQDFLPVDN